jgi:hypothetical protein
VCSVIKGVVVHGWKCFGERERERDVDGGEERDFPLMGASDFFIRRGENNVLLSYFGLDDIRTIGCLGIVSGLVTRYFGSKGRSGGLGPPIIHFIRRMSSKALLSIGEGRRSGGGGGGGCKISAHLQYLTIFFLCA